MSDDFRDLNLDRPTRRELKTADQILKHTVDGYLENRSVDRALHLLTVGDELQKISVMKNLPTLIKEDLTSCMQRVIPRMQQTLPHGSTEYNKGACDAVRVIAQQNLMSTENFTKVFLQHALNSLESRDTNAANHWLNALLDITQVLPVPVLQAEVLPVAVGKAQISKPVPVRITSCKILGRLALSFTAFMVKKDIIPVVISLCQDVSGEVRAAMSTELPNISSTLGLETSNFLLNHVLDLVSDEEIMVREAAIEAVAHMLPRFPPDTLKNTIIPLTKKVFAEIMKNEDNLLLVLSRFYGQYAVGMKGVMNAAEKGQFLQRYIQLSQLNANTRRKFNPYKPIVIDEDELALRLTECRLNCAYNYPAMVIFSMDLKQELVDALYTVLRNLASDSFCHVRRKIAAGFYEVMKLMPKWHPALKTEFIRLLKDEIDIVLEGLVPNVSNILQGFAQSSTLTSDKVESGKDVGQALFVCEKNLSEAPHWRLHEELLLALRAVPKVFHPEFVYLYFVPLLLARASNGRILPCRVAALHTLLVIVVDPSQAKQKLKIRNKILELCNNSSFHCRLLFLRGMNILMSLSPDVLKELFFHNITSMAEDRVPNIRLVVCKMLPRLKTLASEPLDRKLLASVDACLATLAGETDRDVLAQLKTAVNLMDEGDKLKGLKRISTDHETYVSTKGTNLKFPGTITTLTDIRSQASNATTLKSNTSAYSVAQQQPLINKQYTSKEVLGTRSQPEGSGRPSIPGPSRVGPSRTIHKAPDTKKPLHKLSPDEFMVDAGIPLKTTTVMKRIPTPRPIHRPMLAVGQENGKKHEIKENSRKSSPEPITSVRTSLLMINKNVSVTVRSSNLPLKKSLKPLSNDEIEKELLQCDAPRTYYMRTSDRLKYPIKPMKTVKKENKRYSLDVSEITNGNTRIETRNSNINKRYSLDVDHKKDIMNKKSLSCINNNTLVSPKLGSTRSGIVRPQSCVLQSEKVNHAKRSMSVENLPPKVTRLTSRLPVRATDPKPLKPK